MTKPKTHNLDANAYIEQHGGVGGHAPTKAEHDARVANTGRPYTDAGPRLRRTLMQEAHPNKSSSSSIPHE